MFNTFLYNDGLYGTLSDTSPTGSGSAVSDEVPPGSIFFGEYEITSPPVRIVNNFNPDTAPSRDTQYSRVPRSYGGRLIQANYVEKIITVEGTILAETREQYEQEVQQMKTALTKQEQYLRWHESGQTRRALCSWISTENAFDNSQDWKRTFGKFNLTFKAVAPPFTQAKDYQVHSDFGVSTLIHSLEITTDGNAPMEPVFVLSFSAADTISSVKIENFSSGEVMTIETSPSAGQLLIVDTEVPRCLILGGAEQPYTGDFISLINGSNLLRITVTGNSCEYDLTAKHKPYYL